MSGTGRGRGWLNIKNGSARPGGPVTSDSPHNAYEPIAVTTFEDGNKFKDIVGLVRQLNVHDDGIMQNRKLNGLYQVFSTEFKDDKEISECVQYLFQLGLKDEAIATNFAWMMSMQPFFLKPIYEVKIRNFLINDLQEYYNKAKQRQMSDPKEFRNFVKTLARFTRAKLGDGSSMKIFAKPLTECLEMLLDTGRPEDIESFIEQFNVSLLYLQNASPEDLHTILMKIRELIIKNELATCKCRSRLLLALDLSEKGCLSSSLYKFYLEQLGETAMIEFQTLNTPLTIQLPMILPIQESNQNLEVNSLPPCLENNLVIKDNLKNTSIPKQHNFKPNNYNDHGDMTQHQVINEKRDRIGNWEAPKEKTGRPILGAGVRYNAGNNDNWNNDEHSKKQYSNWDKPQHKNFERKFGGNSKNTAWQHDDRFDTDY